MRRYASNAEIQRAVNLKATGKNNCEIAREIGRPHQTIGGWFFKGGLVDRLGLTPNVEIVKEEVPPAKARVRVPAGSSTEGAITRVLAMGDAHDTPNLDKRRFRWMGKLGADRGVHWAVSIGDWLTIDSLNSHIGNDTILGKHKSPWLSDMQSAKEAFGEFAIGMGSHKCNKHLVEGNHERRIYFFEEARPEIAGVLTGEFHQLVEDHGWTHTPYGEFKYIAGVGFIHCALNRLNKSYGGKNAENTISNDAVHDIVLGHSHRAVQVRAPKLGPSKHITVLNLGCALPQGHVEAYMYHGATTGWWFGAHVLTLQGGQIASVEQVTMGQLEAMYG
jgi:hypothetical protein